MNKIYQKMKKLKLGVIGTGRIGKVHIATLVQSVPQAKWWHLPIQILTVQMNWQRHLE